VLELWVRGNRTADETTRLANALQVGISKMSNPEDYMDIDMHAIPTDTLFLNIDSAAVARSGMLLQDSIPERMAISLRGMGGLDKSKLMILEMLAHANWERPIYVAMTVGSENYMSLDRHFIQEGLAYRITPFNTREPGMTDFDVEKVYDNVMHRFKFGGIDKPGVYLDETVMRMCLTHRQLMVQLADRLLQRGDSVRCAEVLAKMDKEIPSYNVPYDFDSRLINYQGQSIIYSNGSSMNAAEMYISLGQDDKAREILDYFWKRAKQFTQYYLSLDQSRFQMSNNECLKQFNQMQKVMNSYFYIDNAKAEQMELELTQLLSRFQTKGGDLRSVYWNYM
jgi:hypothetical protein